MAVRHNMGDRTPLDPSPVRSTEGVLFDPDFNDASINDIILKSSDDICFRVKDYHLKSTGEDDHFIALPTVS
jgi:hypothetical protein